MSEYDKLVGTLAEKFAVTFEGLVLTVAIAFLELGRTVRDSTLACTISLEQVTHGANHISPYELR